MSWRSYHSVFFVLFILIGVTLVRPFGVYAQPAVPEQHSLETKHFIIKWTEETATQSDTDSLARFSERVFAKISDFIGLSRVPKLKIVINLDGEARYMSESIPKFKVPYVNSAGEIHLFLYPDGYFGVLPHEMIHAFRIQTGFTGNTFFEEGIAEWISSFETEVKGFPRYGFSLTLVAGQWLETGKAIALEKMLTISKDMNLECQAQLYPLRADFMLFLSKKKGKDFFMEKIYDAKVVSQHVLEKSYNSTIDQLGREWKEDLERRYNLITNKEELSKKYNKSPIQFMKVCE
jgi:hypothetical protein